jgi:hypothetical protein
MVMLLRMLSSLTMVRVTVGYAATLIAVATTLVVLGPRAQNTVVSYMSTNLHNLVRGHVGTLLGSAFVTENGPIYVWLPGLVCLLALAELLWHGRRLVLTLSLGHIGASLIVAAGLAAAIRFGWTSISVARATDVGISYGAVAVLGALTAAIPARWAPAWVGWWLAVGIVGVSCGGGFTSVGHIVALCLGLLLSVRFRSEVGWTPVRGVLLVIGVSFGYLVLVNGLPVVTAPLAGLAAGFAAYAAAALWRGRQLRRSPPAVIGGGHRPLAGECPQVAALPAKQPALG